MRHLVYGVLTSLLLAAPAAAQSGSSADTAASKSPQDQAAKESKVPAAKSGQAAPAPQASQPAKDDSLTNYDVNGSNASDAMGASR